MQVTVGGLQQRRLIPELFDDPNTGASNTLIILYTIYNGQNFYAQPRNRNLRTTSLVVPTSKKPAWFLCRVPDSALWRMTPKCEPTSRIVALRDGVVVWLDCRHFAVDAHVSQTTVETITGGLKRQTFIRFHKTAHHFLYTQNTHTHNASRRNRETTDGDTVILTFTTYWSEKIVNRFLFILLLAKKHLTQYELFLVISPEVTYKTGQMSVCVSVCTGGVNIFKRLTLLQ